MLPSAMLPDQHRLWLSAAAFKVSHRNRWDWLLQGESKLTDASGHPRAVPVQTFARSSRRRILPTGLLGSSSLNSTYLGRLYAVKFSRQ